ncbi:MAG: hypothetical protein LBF78_13980 [Treponema sp.]|nr:hypothetical protein [Treponema sp.]
MTKKIPGVDLNKTNWFNRGTGAALFFCVLLILSCDFPGNLPDGGTYLTVNLSGASGGRSGPTRSVLSDNDTGGLAYKVTFTGPGGTVIERVAEGGSISIALSAGAWSIAAEAYNPGDMGGTLVGSGTAAVTVVPGQPQSVTVPMYVDPAYEAGLTNIYIHNEAELRRIGTDFVIDGTINFYLEKDITLTQPWTAIGSNSDPFKAVFDGQGHTVTIRSFGPAIKETGDVWVYQGFFAVVETAAIKNINVKYELSGSVDISTGDGSTYHDSCAGGVAGQARNSSFEKIQVSGNFAILFDGMSSLNVGGIAGASDNGTITNCHVVGAIGGTSANYLPIGGIVGSSESGTIISDSSFTGAVNGSAVGNCIAGGIAGYMNGDITASYTSAIVQGAGGGVYAGGIAGWLLTGSIDRCYAWANVSADGTTDVYAGGIAGQNNFTITKCYVRGAVLGENGSSEKYAGGIAGNIIGGTIEYCAALNDSISFSSAVDVGGIGGREISGEISSGSYTSNYAASDIVISSTNTTTNLNLIGNTTYIRSNFEGPPAGTVYSTGNLNWDFASDWKWLSGYSYPVLSWQTTPPDLSFISDSLVFTWP